MNLKIKNNNYNPSEIQGKWQKKWEEVGVYKPDLDKAKKPFYNLMMFPYLSAEGMHVGNMYAFTGADVYGRFQRMQGKDVFEPIGLDGFGIHSENYAIKVGNHPVEQAKISERNFYRQLKSIGNGFDWARTVETYDTSYYKWTQWLFIQLFKAGLAYRKKAPVNFCPSCKTVLADEQVLTKLKINPSTSSGEKLKIEETVGVCERCETEVVKRELEQWFFKITQYADRLLSNIDKLDWSEKVKIAQRQWIGRSEGALIEFKIQNSKFKIEVFTTRADTLFGTTFLVLSPEHPIASQISNFKFQISNGKIKEVQKYIEAAKKKTEQERGMEGKEKTGVFSGLYAINPLNQEEIPIWIADYAIMGYGTGALFGDAHDERDVEFANKYGITLKPTLITGNKERDKRIMDLKECFTGYGILINSGEFSGLKSEDAKKKVTEWLSKNASGGPKTTYHLRDWLISRQRYWGPPIPMIHCKKCGWQSVPEDQLPVKLPFIEDYKPLGTGQAPLASHPEFYKTKCPKCGMDAKRETDVSDTFLDSSWYFLRYLATDRDDLPFPMKTLSEHSENSAGQKVGQSDTSDNQKFRSAESSEFSEIDKRLRWLPVNMYIGGVEHSVLHLLYSRFITMVLKDLGFISFEEPFKKFRAHGLIVKDGAKMSKSKGNVVIPDEYIKKFGADTLRTYLMFMGPFSQGGDFRDSGIEGMSRFIKRVWRLILEHSENSVSQSVRKSNASDNQKVRHTESSEFSEHMMHKTIKRVTEDIEGLHYNTAIAALMEWYNFLSDQKSVSQEEMETFAKLFAPFAPHISEELWQNVILSANEGSHEILRSAQNDKSYVSVHNSSWPIYDPKFLEKDEFLIIVQVNGKLRGNITVDRQTAKDREKVESSAGNDSKVIKHLKGKRVVRVIYVEGKVINFVVA